MNNILLEFKGSTVYEKFQMYLSSKFQMQITTLENKSFHILLGFIIDFLYTEGFEVIVSKRGYKLTTHRDKKIKIDDYHHHEDDTFTLYMFPNNAPTIDNYYLACKKMFMNINKSIDPF